jgi:omega-amidase
MQDLNVTLIQANLFWENPNNNLKHFEILLERVSKTDLIVLPEMFTTGFTMESKNFADFMEGKSVNWMRNQAEKIQAVITGSLIIEEDGKYFNRLIWMQPDGDLNYYDKRHLFSLAGEDKHYTAGNRKIFPEVNEWKILPLICYDLRFPVWSRQSPPFTELGAHPYDLLLYVANWPDRRIYAWQQLLIARAIENQAYVAGVNRVGADGNGVIHSGHSALINPMGERLVEIVGEEAIIQQTLSAETLDRVRTNLPFLDDRDEFELRR